MNNKKDIILIVVSIILVIVLIGGFIYDRNSALLARTNYFDINEDENLELVKMNKAGFLYMRAGYEAKIKIKDGRSDKYIVSISSIYGGQGQMFDYEQYKQYEAEVLNKVTIKPNPRSDSYIWMLGVPLEQNSTKNIVYIVTVEGDGEGYIYLYYSRK
ncbi:MAG: hypothetical protein K6A80_07095 [Saccharofermentans sp.]|nr:hypothetical protein [Saccharofermentans sp.]